MEAFPGIVAAEQFNANLRDTLPARLGSTACEQVEIVGQTTAEQAIQGALDVHNSHSEGDDDEDDPVEDPTTCLCGNLGDCDYLDCQNGAYHGLNSSMKYIDSGCHHWKPLQV